MKKVKFIYNPSSGESNISEYLDRMIALYQSSGYLFVPYRLDFRGSPRDITFDLNNGYDHIVISGGDGTVNYVVNVLKSESIDIPVAVLPTGTANDFANLVGSGGNDILKECRNIINGNISTIDLGKANGSYFVNVFSCGLLTEVSQKTPTIFKNIFGKLAYYVEGLGELSRFRKFKIRIESDGGSYEGNCIIFFVFNGRTAGGLNIAYLSDPNDGLLDVLIIKGNNPLKTIQTLIQYISPLSDHTVYPQGIEHIRCSKLTAYCDSDEATDIDGQPGPHFPVDIQCMGSSLNVIRPAGKK